MPVGGGGSGARVLFTSGISEVGSSTILFKSFGGLTVKAVDSIYISIIIKHIIRINKIILNVLNFIINSPHFSLRLVTSI